MLNKITTKIQSRDTESEDILSISEQKRKVVNFASPKTEIVKSEPLTPVLANVLSLADAAEILAVIERFNKSNKVNKAKNGGKDISLKNNAKTLEQIFQTQFQKVASYLQDKTETTFENF